MKKVICNEGCNQEFVLVKLGSEQVIDDIERVCFSCPYCEKKYTAFYTNDKVKKLQEEQRELLKRSDPRKLTKRQLQGIMFKIDNKKRQIKEEMDRIRKELEVG